LAVDGTVNGQPLILSSDGGATYDLYFVRRNDHNTSGSLTYTYQFSSDLVTFENSVVTPTLVAPSTDNTDYEVMKVAFPVNARFGRIGVIETP